MYTFLDSDLAQAGGYTVTIGAIALKVIDFFSQYNINDYAQGAMALGGFIFLCYKIANARVDRRNKLLDEQIKKKQLEDN